jgi:hypothetical protein
MAPRTLRATDEQLSLLRAHRVATLVAATGFDRRTVAYALAGEPVCALHLRALLDAAGRGDSTTGGDPTLAA